MPQKDNVMGFFQEKNRELRAQLRQAAFSQIELLQPLPYRPTVAPVSDKQVSCSETNIPARKKMLGRR